MQTSTIPLKYLFIATFADGATYRQTPDDESRLEPGVRSQFYDVLKKAETCPIVRFELNEIPAAAFLPKPGNSFAVDLIDGHFEVNGTPFKMHEEELVGFELVFFRNHTHSFNQRLTGTAQPKEVSHDVVYRIGWKLKGQQTYQRVMQIE